MLVCQQSEPDACTSGFVCPYINRKGDLRK